MTLHDFWPIPEFVTKCMPSEAEVISNAAFLAVHQPMRLFRRSLTESAAPLVPATERTVLDALLTKRLPEGYVIVPIVGPSGVGKSHLIRWLGLHVTGNRHVIQIPKSTSLRRILESILNGLVGPVYDEIREQLRTAREQLDDITAEEDLLAKFRAALRKRRDEARAACDEALRRHGKVAQELRAIAETHADGLYSLLEGPTKVVLLNGTEANPSVFRTLVRRVTTGIIEAEHGEFTAAHFEFPTIQTNKLSDQKLRSYVQKLKTNTQNERATAAALMNSERDRAVGQLLGLGEHQLADLFGRVRAELTKEKKELVLLIEDFTTLAGVQRGLLDVIKMQAVTDNEVRCPLRTALAVTEGFLSDYDTIKTRASYEFVLREQPAERSELDESIIDMVGAYLNAARLGPERLDHWFVANGGNPDAKRPAFESVVDGLSDKEQTALDAFGKSRQGYSLFPFNRAAVRQLAEQHLASGGQLKFNPRKLIKDVLQATLWNDRDAFERGDFPYEGFHQFNAAQLSMDVERWLEKRRPADHGRYKVLLGYWGDRPRQPEQLNLPAAVYETFGLSPLSEGTVERPPEVEPKKEDKVAQVPPPNDDPLQKIIDERLAFLDRWATEKKIKQLDATLLRNELLEMIDAAIDWDSELLSVPRDLQSRPGKAAADSRDEEDSMEVVKFPRESLRSAIGPNWVYLPFSKTATGATVDDALFTVCAEDEASLLSVRFELRALVRFHTRKTFDYEGGDEDRAWYARLCERAVRQAIPFLRRRYERVPENDAAVTAVAQALYVSARVLNLDGAHSNQDAEVLDAVLHPGPGGFPETADRWQEFRQACAVNRLLARDFLLRRIAVRQGGGDTLYGIDGTRLLTAIAPVRKSCKVEAEFPGKSQDLDENARKVRGFVVALGPQSADAAVKFRRDALAAWAASTRSWLGDDFDKKAFVTECIELLKQAKELGVFRADVEYETLRKMAKSFEESAVVEAMRAVDRLTGAPSPGVLLTALVQAPDDAMRTAETFRDAFDAFVKQTLPYALSQINKTLGLAQVTQAADPNTILAAEAAKLDADLQTIAAALPAENS